MKARDIKPAVISAMALPRNGAGTSATTSAFTDRREQHHYQREADGGGKAVQRRLQEIVAQINIQQRYPEYGSSWW